MPRFLLLALVTWLVLFGCHRQRLSADVSATDATNADWPADAVLGGADTGTEQQAANEPPAPLPTEATPLQFDDQRFQRRYDALRACVLDRVDGTWVHQPPGAKIGYVREEVWCRPATGKSTCSVRLNEADASEYYLLRTLTSEPDRDERLELTAYRVADVGGWNVGISLQPWTGGFSFVFSRGDESINIGTLYSFQHEYVNISPPSDTVNPDVHAWLDAEMGYSLVSAQSLRDRAFTRLDAVLASVEQAVQSHTLSICPDRNDPQRFQCGPMANGEGHVMRDTCTRRRLTVAEETDLLEAARRDHGARRRLVARHHVELHAALMEALPLQRCWLPISPPQNAE